MSLTYSVISGTTWVNGMSASAANLNQAVNSASIFFNNGLTLVGNPSGSAGSMADVPFSTFLQAANNLSDLVSVPTARTSLGLGTAALVATSTLLQVSNNLSDLGSASTARTNLGLGTAAVAAASSFLAASNNLSDVASASTARTNLALGSASNVTFNSLTTGAITGEHAVLSATGGHSALVATGSASQLAAQFAGNGSAGTSVGINVSAGTNSSDMCASFWKQSGTSLFEIRGDGAIQNYGQLTNIGVMKVGGSAYDVASAKVQVDGTIHVTNNTNSPSTLNGMELAFVPTGGAGSAGLGALTAYDHPNSLYREVHILGHPVIFYAKQSSILAALSLNDSTSTGIQFNQYGSGSLSTDASGNVTASSDIRMKTAVKPFEKSLRHLRYLKPISYRWKKGTGMETKGRYVGFSAQAVKKVLPEAVGKDPAGKLSLSDRALLAVLVNAVNALDLRTRSLAVT